MSGYEKYGSGENGFCPECGAKVTVLHSSCVNKLVSYVWPMSFERAGYDLICYLWRVERWVEKDGSIGLYASPWEAYVFGEKTAAVYKRWENGFFGTYYVSDAWKKLQKFEDRAYDIDLVYNPEGIEQATRGTWAENSKLEIYMGVESEYRFPIAWLKLDQAARTEKTLKEQIRELETRPQPVAVQRDEKAIEEAVQKAKAAAAAEWSEKTKKLTDKLNEANAKAEKLKAKVDKASAGADEKLAAAERETARIRQELEAAQKKLKASNGNVAAFGVYFKSVQENFNSMMEKVREIGEEDQETAKKLCGAARVILNKAIERLGEG